MTTATAENMVWIGNLGKYNEGELVGEWFDFPLSMDIIAQEIGLDAEYEEFFIGDYEGLLADFNFGEYASIEELNEVVEQLDSLDEIQAEAVTEIMSLGIAQEIEEAVNIAEDDLIVYHDCKDMGDVAHQYMEETGQLDEMGELASRYFNFDALGRDMDIEGTFFELEGEVYVQVLC
ncbi:antirestriction protein ArdA (plasmid) [Halobacillus litoralis]|uniref:antirestriction protein ArdA n=1 Tax=Halobacillus litoralis TaxID=45668 RepID=UPI001CFEDE8C|nr:antirestriction protein ArdA [Halobacillus litoralis]WLR49573.1 antirestriction protein ArdA [Halobacillus litoralis]